MVPYKLRLLLPLNLVIYYLKSVIYLYIEKKSSKEKSLFDQMVLETLKPEKSNMLKLTKVMH